jgi:hypothetical protein
MAAETSAPGRDHVARDSAVTALTITELLARAQPLSHPTGRHIPQ